MQSMKTWLAAVLAFTQGACGAHVEENPDAVQDVEVGELASALSAIEVPVCTQRTAQSMTAVGEHYYHGSSVVRLVSPGSLLYWQSPLEAGRWEFRIRARAHYAGLSYPMLRFWAGGNLIDEVVVDNVSDYATFSFAYDNPSASSNTVLAIQLVAFPSHRALVVDGVDIVCPGVTCVDTVCTGEEVCCVNNTSGAAACMGTNQCPFTSQGQLTQMSCDSHDDCGAGNLCVGVRFSNFEFAITCVAEENWVPVSGSTVMLPVCGSPGRQPDSCPQGFTCGPATSELGIRTCQFD